MTDQLRANRKHGIEAWLRKGTPDGKPRWDGDDGRRLERVDIIQMRLDIADGKGTQDDRDKWQKIVDAEDARFGTLDAEYEAAKAKLTE